jgi:hypothetical protein
MKKAVKPLLMASFFAAALGATLTHPAIAQIQPNSTDPLGNFQGENNSDPFSERGDNQINSLMQLLHQANFGSIRTGDQFGLDQQEQIGDAASDFRTRQRNAVTEEGQAGQPSSQIDFIRPVYIPNSN